MPQKVLKRYTSTSGFDVELVKKDNHPEPYVVLDIGDSSYGMLLSEAANLSDSLRLASLCFATEFEDLSGDSILGAK